jgi:argininosuccinate lyase
MAHRTWGGRFAEGPDALAARFNASLPFDRALWREDLWQNRVHARMLKEAGLLTEEELEAILKGLDQIEREIEAGTFPWREELEDVHMNLEARLTELIGPPGGKLHTARSRNDQVATDLRLFLRSALDELKNPDILELVRAKSGRVLGALVALSTVLKGLPLAYNKDLQEDKEPLLDALATYRDSLRLLMALLPGLRWNRERMWQAAEGLPFREAHHVVGRLVRKLSEEGRALKDLTLQDLKAHHPLFAEDALPLLRLESAIHQRRSYGGTAPEAVRERLLEAKKEVGLA